MTDQIKAAPAPSSLAGGEVRYEGGRLDFTHAPSLGAFIGKSLASLVSGNRMPEMSGDDRKRIPDHIRHRFDRSCEELASAILAALSPEAPAREGGNDMTAYRAVDACGGTYSADEKKSGFAAGHREALSAAMRAVAMVDRRHAEALSSMAEDTAQLVGSLIGARGLESQDCRMALAIAANTIRRGRLLTEDEQLANLADGAESVDPAFAAFLRSI